VNQIIFRPFDLPRFNPAWKTGCTGCRHLVSRASDHKRKHEAHTILICKSAPAKHGGGGLINAIEARDPHGWCGPLADKWESA